MLMLSNNLRVKVESSFPASLRARLCRFHNVVEKESALAGRAEKG